MEDSLQLIKDKDFSKIDSNIEVQRACVNEFTEQVERMIIKKRNIFFNILVTRTFVAIYSERKKSKTAFRKCILLKSHISLGIASPYSAVVEYRDDI